MTTDEEYALDKAQIDLGRLFTGISIRTPGLFPLTEASSDDEMLATLHLHRSVMTEDEATEFDRILDTLQWVPDEES